MKITFVLPGLSLSGGVRVVVVYAQHLIRMGHDVKIVAPPSPMRSWKSKLKAWFAEHRWPLDSEPPASHLDGSGVECRILSKHRPMTDFDVPDADVIIATWWETAEWINSLSSTKGAKAYLIQHHEVFEYLPKERVQATYRLPLHKIVISNWLLQIMRQVYDDRSVDLVPNGVDPNLFFAPPRGKQVVPTVGLLYATADWKGLDVSLKAIGRVMESFPKLRVIAFGTETVASHLPLPANSVFHHQPAQQAIRELYASCDVWLCGSYSEGFGLPPLEAMACRCPVVSTEVGGPIDFIRSGVNGHLVPVGDAGQLAGRLIEVLGLDEAAWRRLSDAAFATSLSYNWNQSSLMFEKALYRAIQRTDHGELPALG